MKTWKRILIILTIIGIISGLSYFTFSKLGLTSIAGIQTAIQSFGYWAILTYILLYVLQTIFLSFIPGTGAAFIIASIAVFGAWSGFLISAISIIITSTLLYLLGSKVSEKLLINIFGFSKEDLEKAKQLVNTKKSKIAFPMMMIFPFFPDDALCLVAGMTKMNFKYFMLAAFIPRSIGAASLAFVGSGVLGFSKLAPIEWIALINLVIIDAWLIIRYIKQIELFFIKIYKWIRIKLNKNYKVPEDILEIENNLSTQEDLTKKEINKEIENTDEQNNIQ